MTERTAEIGQGELSYRNNSSTHNYNKILKSDWLSTVFISVLMGQCNRTVRVIRHLHSSHNTPRSPQKFCENFIFTFSRDNCDTQEKLKTMVNMQKFGGQTRWIMEDAQMVNA